MALNATPPIQTQRAMLFSKKKEKNQLFSSSRTASRAAYDVRARHRARWLRARLLHPPPTASRAARHGVLRHGSGERVSGGPGRGGTLNRARMETHDPSSCLSCARASPNGNRCTGSIRGRSRWMHSARQRIHRWQRALAKSKA
jgi:hypothetical protein